MTWKPSGSDPRHGAKYQCLTWNLLNAWQPGTPVYGTAASRAKAAAEWLLEQKADVLCFQEMDFYYRGDTDFCAALSEEYEEADTVGDGVGKSWNPIFYRKGTFVCPRSGGWSFPKNGFTPIPTGNAKQEDYPERACNESLRYCYPENSAEAKSGWTLSKFRSLSWALLQTAGGDAFLVANTHFSLRPWCHREETGFVSRELAELSATFGCPVLLCGDFNSSVSRGAAKRLLETGWEDSRDRAEHRNDFASCHPSSGKGDGEPDKLPEPDYTHAIDHVFLMDPTRQVVAREYLTLARESLLNVSDHCPTTLLYEIRRTK